MVLDRTHSGKRLILRSACAARQAAEAARRWLLECGTRRGNVNEWRSAEADRQRSRWTLRTRPDASPPWTHGLTQPRPAELQTLPRRRQKTTEQCFSLAVRVRTIPRRDGSAAGGEDRIPCFSARAAKASSRLKGMAKAPE